MLGAIRQTLVLGSITAGFVGLPAIAHAGPCDPVTKYTQDVWGQLNKIADEACKEGSGCKTKQAKAQKLYEQADKVVKWWNDMTKGTWAQLGPRNFAFGSKNQGTLVAPGDRTWISTMPSASDSVAVTLTASEGKGYAVVAICVADESGQPTLKETFEIKTNQTVKKTLSGVAGKILSVRLDGKGGLGKKVAYQLAVK